MRRMIARAGAARSGASAPPGDHGLGRDPITGDPGPCLDLEHIRVNPINEPQGAAATHRKGAQPVGHRPRGSNSALERAAAVGEAAHAQAPVVGEQARGLGEHRLDLAGREQVEDVIGHEAVESPVAAGKRGLAVGGVDSDTVAERREALTREPDHDGTEIDRIPMGLNRQAVTQHGLGETARPRAQLEDGAGVIESRADRQGRRGNIFVPTLAVLAATDAVVERA